MQTNYRLGRAATAQSAIRFVAISALLIGAESRADFHVWYDSQGQKQVSSVPRRGVDITGEIRRPYNPNSIVYQHRKMREVLAREASAIAQAQELSRREEQFIPRLDGTSGVRHAPREGTRSLEQLIDLEKRGGKWQP